MTGNLMMSLFLVGSRSSMHQHRAFTSCIHVQLPSKCNSLKRQLSPFIRSSRAICGGIPNTSSLGEKNIRSKNLNAINYDNYDITKCRKVYYRNTTSAANNISPDGSEKLSTLVLLRHGQSTWNAIPTFTGWCDAPLTDQGISEAKAAGKLLYERGFKHFDVAYTSTLQRAVVTCELALEGIKGGTGEDESTATSMIKAWELNERHYGALQGFRKNDEQLTAKYGEEQMKEWRRDFRALPPPMDEQHKYYEPPPAPLTESLKLCQDRVLSYWDNTIYPSLIESPGTNVLIAAHSNTLRALVTYLDGVPLENVPNIHIPNSIPCIYQFDTSATDGNMRIVSPLLECAGGNLRSRGQWLFSSENYMRLRDKIGGDSKSFLRSMFEAWDLNGDGVLSKEEIIIGLNEIKGGADVSVAAIAGKIFNEVDADGSETLDMEEFESHAAKACRKFMPDLIEGDS